MTLQNLPQHGLAIVFTDNPSHDLGIEGQLITLRDEKRAKIFIVLAPKYHGTIGDDSWQVYDRLSEGRIYNMADFNATHFIEDVAMVVGEDCEGSNLVPAGATGHLQTEATTEAETSQTTPAQTEEP